MREWDTAASNPCPFCAHLTECPAVGKPHDGCREMWPLGEPTSRRLATDHPMQEQWKNIALANSQISAIVEYWSDGKSVTDDRYLTIRAAINGARTQEAAQAYWYIMSALLTPKSGHYVLDAAKYYGMNLRDRQLKEVSARALEGGVIVANELMVNADQSVLVLSHFERIVMEVVKICLCSYAGMPFVRLSREKKAFKGEVEEEWRRVLQYGNGFHGFTVYPRVHIDDLVRYQHLKDVDDLVSWSISNWVIWSMTAFPSIVQTLIPDFGEKVFGSRLRKMYEPLVQSYATRAVTRARLVDGNDDAPKRSYVVDELRSLLWHAIKEYDFNYGKSDAMLSSVGFIGPESSPAWREHLAERFNQFDLPFGVNDFVHIGFSRYIAGKFDEHLRTCYPWYDPEFGDADKSPGTMVDGEGEVAEVFREESTRTRLHSDVGDGVPVALEADGVQYLYIQQMSFVCGPEITEDQLRNWDRRGHLETLRMRDIDPGAPETIADRRVYPYTNEMIEQVQKLAERKEVLQANPKEGVLSRKEAAERLGISTRTLDNWRKQGDIEAVQVEHRVFIPEAEVQRLLDEQNTE